MKFAGGEERCRLLVVATGVWCNELFPELRIQRKQGVSFRLAGKLTRPFIKPWAPYKQVVAHQQSAGELWVGDGSAILEKNWDENRVKQCLTRCQKAVGVSQPPLKTLTGLRAYSPSGNDPCVLKKVGPRAWVATGAGKSGTIAAGWVANKLLSLQ